MRGRSAASLPEKRFELFRDDCETNRPRCCRNQRCDMRAIKFLILQQTSRESLYFLNRAREAARLGKSQSVDGAIPAHTGNPAKQSVARHLAGNEAGV